MLFLGPVGFATPLALLGLIALPLLWILLRTLPPPARLQVFPPVVLLGGLKDDDSETKSIPLWLRLMRILAVAAAIIGFSDPTIVGEGNETQESGKPALLLVEAGWAGAAGWDLRKVEILEILERRRHGGTPVLLLAATDLPHEFQGFREAGEWIDRLPGLLPKPWLADGDEVRAWIESRIGERFDTWWFSDGLEIPGHAGLAELLAERGDLTVLPATGPVLALGTPEIKPDSVRVPVRALGHEMSLAAQVAAVGSGPDGSRQAIGSVELRLEPGNGESFAEFRLPMQLRNRIEGFEANPDRSAGTVVLAADNLLQRRVGLVTGRGPQEGGTLLSSLHFLRRAVEPFAELVEGGLEEVLQSAPDVIILADASPVPITSHEELVDWIRDGGLLVRFAGPRIATGNLLVSVNEDLLPVRLRPGSRILGGAMSWDTPKALKRFPPGSPFLGLEIHEEITVSRQVLAQPGPDLAKRTLAELEDGTPLVTGAGLGSGEVVLFHVPANAEWSNLPLTGLFLRMLERLALSAETSRRQLGTVGGDALWIPEILVDAFGTLHKVEDAAGVSEQLFKEGYVSATLPPGIYRSGEQIAAVNAVGNTELLAEPDWPVGAVIASAADSAAVGLKGGLLAFAIIIFLVEGWATFRIGGRLATQAAVVVLAVGLLLIPESGEAQFGNEQAIAAVRDTVLAHVITGDPELDRIARAGLVGLSRVAEARTTVDLAEPVGIDPGDDTIAMFPLLYWPISPVGPELTGDAQRNLQEYFRTGGMILFDTRDALVRGGSSLDSNSQRLIEIAGPLGIPSLGIPGSNHTLARSFYLLDEFPGRYRGDIWVEHLPNSDGAVARRTGIDGVTPVVIGGNDWATAWAVNEEGAAMFSVGAGESGVRQRELAYRFGINLIMHALTGNYKLDQLHVDALARIQGN